MGPHFRYFILLLTFFCPLANAIPAPWVLVDGSEPKGWPDGPAGCKEFMSFTSTYDVPLLETGEREFNPYIVFSCEKRRPKRFLIWRTRHYKGKVQWVGELGFDWGLMSIVKTKSPLNAKYQYQAFPGYCLLKGDTASAMPVNALLHGAVASGAAFRKYLVVAWKVDKEAKRLVRIPPADIGECFLE